MQDKLISANALRDEIDKWLEVVEPVPIARGISYYAELEAVFCME